MEKSASFLFAGANFNKKKFASDFDRFKEKKEAGNLADDREPEEVLVSAKKRKRKARGSDMIGRLRSKKARKGLHIVKDNDESSKRKKELNRQIERDAVFRKKHKIHVSGNDVASPLKNFAELSSRYGCESYLLQNIADLGFKEPTPIQRQAIPVLLSGQECFACAPTGSGKTLAFVCPMLMKLKHPSADGVRAVILCPTRELATQTTRECKRVAKGKKFRITLMTRELLRKADFSKLPCDIIISTPQRLRLAIRKKKIDLSRVEYLVLDESDKLFEIDMLKKIDSIVKACTNPSIVRSLFSATLPDFVEELARTIMHDAVRVIIGRKNAASDTIKQRLIFAGSEEGKLISLRQSFAESLNPPVLIFLQNKVRAKELYEELKFDDIRVDVIHSDLSQAQREDSVDNFRAGKTWVLIATDVIARGMDFKGVNCVINYDFPDSSLTYIHRIGRTGRAGRGGEAITFYTKKDIPLLRNIANVMVASGCEVPSWILVLRKQKWKKHLPRRDSISIRPQDEE
ncbi:DEAD-box ATP-dependent RNA helicase 57 isoform X1 [Tripterygium wilfordii]|uniref:RNA helicase n=1 Tax=Tripterygium wilfordii TaxID=458696 RepID=A0A7J7CUC7_TRIWF|nr:DEAD-box ATP-dependent RNA helicase 57-like [Tripterygium wilfordii]KAF5737559.1 DEAD-box ATP-dependent RNA helicase 57 isoform X1 [Tripterygium wilfordii]